MNIYRVLMYDGYFSRERFCKGYSIVDAIQNDSYIVDNQVIRAELVSTGNQENTFDEVRQTIV